TPVTRIEYSFAGRMYEALAVGRAGEERFWAETFPPRWNRLSRFVQAVARDLAGESRQRPGADHPYNGGAIRERSHIRIIEEPLDEPHDATPGQPDEPGPQAES
ncbi:MAG: hypothetical protein KGO05_15710, partial [Chloroflexota bacterium]|nr:hypothetical protein [Chloroflexota bacterium]